MSIRPRKKNDTKISLNRAYQVVLNPLVTEKATQMSEFNKIVFAVPLDANKLDIFSAGSLLLGHTVLPFLSFFCID